MCKSHLLEHACVSFAHIVVQEDVEQKTKGEEAEVDEGRGIANNSMLPSTLLESRYATQRKVKAELNGVLIILTSLSLQISTMALPEFNFHIL